jgi:hypothetical protein
VEAPASATSVGADVGSEKSKVASVVGGLGDPCDGGGSLGTAELSEGGIDDVAGVETGRSVAAAAESGPLSAGSVSGVACSEGSSVIRLGGYDRKSSIYSRVDELLF